MISKYIANPASQSPKGEASHTFWKVGSGQFSVGNKGRFQKLLFIGEIKAF